jgi:hypothetical protein
MTEKKVAREWNTITISTTPMIRERLDYIRKYLGINSRSAAVALVVNEVYDRLVEKGYSRKIEKQIIKETE